MMRRVRQHDVTITAINRAARLVLLDDGRLLPITTLLDRWGEEVDEMEDAVTFVAGEGRLWVVDSLDAYEGARAPH